MITKKRKARAAKLRLLVDHLGGIVRNPARDCFSLALVVGTNIRTLCVYTKKKPIKLFTLPAKQQKTANFQGLYKDIKSLRNSHVIKP